MATLRTRTRKDGTIYVQVLYRHDGKQGSVSFDDPAAANRFRNLVNDAGPERALAVIGVDQPSAPRGLTVAQWCERHIEHLTGVDPNTVRRYRAYLANDVAPALGAIPVAALSREDVAAWLNGLDGAAKTRKNKFGYLSGALNAAVAAGHLSASPCANVRLPRDEGREMRFLSRDEYATLRDAVTEPWQPLVGFLVASGARWGEAVALQPGDVDRTAGTVRIARAWKHGEGGYRLGPPKTAKSRRTINVASSVLDQLDYSGEWLFTNRAGGPVRSHGFYRRVWAPAVARAELAPPPRIHDLRHTCASWMIGAGVPLPVVQAHLGHESISTTVGVYGHLDRRNAEQAAAAIGAMLT